MAHTHTHVASALAPLLNSVSHTVYVYVSNAQTASLLPTARSSPPGTCTRCRSPCPRSRGAAPAGGRSARNTPSHFFIHFFRSVAKLFSDGDSLLLTEVRRVFPSLAPENLTQRKTMYLVGERSERRRRLHVRGSVLRQRHVLSIKSISIIDIYSPCHGKNMIME